MKGNVIVGQSGGPTAAINASIAGVYCGAVECGAPKVYGMCNGIQGLLEERFVDLNEALPTQLEVELLKRTPSAYLGSCRYKLPDYEASPETFEKIFEIIRKLNIECFCYTGGNDSMDTIRKLSDYAKERGITDIKFMGVPKTIDNDLPVTDHTPGFGSAAKYIATSLKEIISDTQCLPYSKGMVTVVEVMGRNAGWLTGAAALCKGEDCIGPDMIYLPETNFDLDNFTARIKELIATKGFAVAVVSEGVHLADGRYVCELGGGADFVDAFGHKQLTGTAGFLARHLGAVLGCKTRAIEFSTLQRAGGHLASETDINESFAVGAAAVRAADKGITGQMVTIDRVGEHPYESTTGLCDVHNVANLEKTVPAEWITEDGTYVTEEFINYVRPLIQGEMSHIMVNGLPRYLLRK